MQARTPGRGKARISGQERMFSQTKRGNACRPELLWPHTTSRENPKQHILREKKKKKKKKKNEKKKRRKEKRIKKKK